MSKMVTLSVTISNDASAMDYIASMMETMREFVGRPCVVSMSVSCHVLDEAGEIADTIYTATPDPIRL